MKIKSFRQICAVICAATLFTGAASLIRAAAPTDPTKNYLGMNTWFAYAEHPFADAMHGGSVQLITDSSGPLTDCIYCWGDGTNAGTQLSVNGTYNIQFTGQATISCPYSAPYTISNQTVTGSITTATLTIAYPNDSLVPKFIWLQFTNTKRTPTSPTNTGIANLTVTYPASVTVDNHTLDNGYQNGAFPTHSPITDADGWPLSDFFVSFGSDAAGTFTGTYALSFTGTATSVASQYNNGVTVGSINYTKETNTSTANVTVSAAAATISLKFVGTKRDSTGTAGVTNIHLLRPGYDGTELFTTEYKTIMAKGDVTRFMDWGSTNFGPGVTWSDRARPGSLWTSPIHVIDPNGLIQHGTTGVPYEVMVQLCNELNTDLYVNVPARANDAYITNLANLIKYGSDGVNPYTYTHTSPVWPPLNSNLKIYVEYGNEVWNNIFQSYTYVTDIGQIELNNGPTNYPTDYDNVASPSAGLLALRFTAYRASQMSLLFRAVFGDSAMPFTATNPRVRPLFESQEAGPGTWLSPALRYLDAFYGSTNAFNTTVHPVAYFFYGGGGAAYYAINGVTATSSSDPLVVFSPGKGNYVGPTWRGGIYADSLWAGNFGLKRTAYEGGMGLNNPTQTGSWTSTTEWIINNNSAMVDVEQEFHDAWTQGGGELLNYYTHGADSRWGFAQEYNDSTAPKVLGLDAIHSTTRPIVSEATMIQGTPTTSVTGTVPIYSLDVNHILKNGTFNAATTPEPTLDGINPGEYIGFGVDAPVAGDYTSTFRYRVPSSTTATNMHIYVNGVLLSNPTGASPATSDANFPATSNLMGNYSVTVHLPAGFSVVRLSCISGNIALENENFSLPDVTAGLVARWNFDSNTTDTGLSGTVTDTGTLVGSPSYVTGTNAVVGTGALSFNGTTQYVNVPNSTDINITSAMSMTAWVKIASTTDNSYRMILSKKLTFTDAGGYELFYHPVLHQLLVRSGGTSTTYNLIQPLTLDTNWHHIAVTINGSSAVFYVDGIAQTGASGVVGNPPSNTQKLTIGCRSGTGEYSWNGQLDDVRLYNRALSAGEVTNIFAQTK